jgi:REP element-mobilizing transposase RayT
VKVWQHVILGSRCSWLHGDPRGFRDRHHRLHSSGDYKNRPPANEHAHVRKYYNKRARKTVSFSLELRILTLREFVQKMRRLGHNIIAGAIAKRHLHALTELPNEYDKMKREIGKSKQKASHAARQLLPGTIWAAGGEFTRIKDRGHLRNTYSYIRERQERGAVVWSHSDDENWVDHPEVGVVVMLRGRKSVRVFARD